MARILVTGGTGFLGRPCVDALRSDGHDVHVATRHPIDQPGAVAHALDLHDHAAVTRLLREVRPSHLLHLAWVTSHGSYYTDPANETWADDSLHLVRAFAAAGGRRFVGAGSSAEYDLYTGQRAVEGVTPLRPNGAYGRAKLRVYEGLLALAREQGFTAAWGRVFFCYGPGEHPSRAIPSIVTRLAAGERVPFQAATGVRDYLHVHDVARAFAALIGTDATDAFNVGSGTGVVYRDLLERFAEAAGQPGRIDFGALPTPSYEPPYVVADVTRLREATGWQPRIQLADGVPAVVAEWLR